MEPTLEECESEDFKEVLDSLPLGAMAFRDLDPSQYEPSNKWMELTAPVLLGPIVHVSGFENPPGTQVWVWQVRVRASFEVPIPNPYLCDGFGRYVILVVTLVSHGDVALHNVTSPEQTTSNVAKHSNMGPTTNGEGEKGPRDIVNVSWA